MNIRYTTDIEVNPEDIYDEDIIYLIQDKIDYYKTLIKMTGEEASKKYEVLLVNFKADILKTITDVTETNKD